MSDEPFVPVDFAVPAGLVAGEFRLEPLGPQHNAADYAAWTGSIDHIRARPGSLGAAYGDLYRVVLAWLQRDWPFDSIEYEPRT